MRFIAVLSERDWCHLGRRQHRRPARSVSTGTRASGFYEEYFGKDRTLESITEGDADGYKRWLLDKFADVPCGPQANESRTVYVSAEDIERVIAACPDNDWRLTFAMPRYAGMRFPSEFRELKWSDVDWENSRFIFYEPKVEHHPSRGHRTVPISAELRPHLERAYAEREEGAVYVVPRVRVISNLGTHAKRLVKKAGVAVWPKLFVNMRDSCSDDLERRGIPEKAISVWIGNTARLRSKHYHSVRAEDWAAVTGVAGQAAPIPAPSAAVSGHQEPSTLHEAREKTLDVPKDTLGGQPLKRKTGVAGEEVEYAAGGRTGPQAPSGKGAGLAGKAHHPGTPPAKSSHGVERLRHGRQFAKNHLEVADV